MSGFGVHPGRARPFPGTNLPLPGDHTVPTSARSTGRCVPIRGVAGAGEHDCTSPGTSATEPLPGTLTHDADPRVVALSKVSPANPALHLLWK